MLTLRIILLNKIKLRNLFNNHIKQNLYRIILTLITTLSQLTFMNKFFINYFKYINKYIIIYIHFN